MTAKKRINAPKLIFGYPLHTERCKSGLLPPPKHHFMGSRSPLFIFCVFGLVGVLCDWPHLVGIPDEHIVFAHAMGLIAIGLAFGALLCGPDS